MTSYQLGTILTGQHSPATLRELMGSGVQQSENTKSYGQDMSDPTQGQILSSTERTWRLECCIRPLKAVGDTLILPYDIGLEGVPGMMLECHS